MQLHETPVYRREASPALPPIILSAVKSAGSRASGCADNHAMALAPVVWEGTYNSEILDSAYRPLNHTIGVTAFAIGKYTRFVGRFLESAEKHFMKGCQVNYYIFTDNPETIPNVQLQPGQRFIIIPIRKCPSWQEISLRRMEAINKHIAETSHQEVDYVFCLDIDMVFYNSWGPETLGDIVAAIHPGYFNVPRSQFPYDRRSSAAAYIPDGEGDFYYGRVMFGGLVKKVYEFTRTCQMTTLTDKANEMWQPGRKKAISANTSFPTNPPRFFLQSIYGMTGRQSPLKFTSYISPWWIRTTKR